MRRILSLFLVMALCLTAFTVLSGCQLSDDGFHIADYAKEQESENTYEQTSLINGNLVGKYDSVEGGFIGVTKSDNVSGESQAQYVYELTNLLTGNKILSRTVYGYDILSDVGSGTILRVQTSANGGWFYYTPKGELLFSLTSENGTASFSSLLLSEREDKQGNVTVVYGITVNAVNYDKDLKKSEKKLYYVATYDDSFPYPTIAKVTEDISANQVFENLKHPDVNVSTLIYQVVDGVEPKKGSIETWYYQKHSNPSFDRFVYTFYASENGKADIEPKNTLKVDATDSNLNYKELGFLGNYFFYQTSESAKINHNYETVLGEEKTVSTYRYDILTGKTKKIKTDFLIDSIQTLTANDGTHTLALLFGTAKEKNVATENCDKVIYVVDADCNVVRDFTFDSIMPTNEIVQLTEERYLVNNVIVNKDWTPIVDLSRYAGNYWFYPTAQKILVKYTDAENGTVAALLDYDGNVISDWDTLSRSTEMKYFTFSDRYAVKNTTFTQNGKVEDYAIHKINGGVFCQSVRDQLSLDDNTDILLDITHGWIVTSKKNQAKCNYGSGESADSVTYSEYNVSIYDFQLTRLCYFTATAPFSSFQVLKFGAGALLLAPKTTYTAMGNSYTMKNSYLVYSFSEPNS